MITGVKQGRKQYEDNNMQTTLLHYDYWCETRKITICKQHYCIMITGVKQGRKQYEDNNMQTPLLHYDYWCETRKKTIRR